MLRIKDNIMAAARKKRSGENGITFSLFLIIIMSMVIVVILAMIKIYLSNQIYYESRRACSNCNLLKIAYLSLVICVLLSYLRRGISDELKKYAEAYCSYKFMTIF
jgi:Na+-transporting NADH:ubiquinone oxidoreductase subunit NqrC